VTALKLVHSTIFFHFLCIFCHLAVWGSMFLQGRGLGPVDGDVLRDQVIPLHPFSPRPPADQDGEVDAFERFGLVARHHDTCNKYRYNVRHLIRRDERHHGRGQCNGSCRPLRRGNAASISSILTPFRASALRGRSSMWRTTGWSGPSIRPLAIIATMAYPI
jgi:hypothetical protein